MFKAGIAIGCVAFAAVFIISTGIVCSKKFRFNHSRENDERAERRKPKAIGETPGSDLANRCTTVRQGTDQEESSSLFSTERRSSVDIYDYIDSAPVYANTTLYNKDHVHCNFSSTERPSYEVDSGNYEDLYDYVK